MRTRLAAALATGATLTAAGLAGVGPARAATTGGTFGAVASHPVGAGELEEPVAVVDANRDGRADVVTIVSGGNNGNGTDSISIRPTPAAGGLGAQTLIPVAPRLSAITVADANGDGLPDIVVVAAGSLSKTQGGVAAPDSGVFVLYAAAGGGFGAPSAYDVGGIAYAANVVLGDLNGDKVPDVVLADGGASAGPTLVTLPGLAGGGFGAPVTTLLQSNASQGLVLADVSGDGRLDALVGDFAISSERIRIFDGIGDGHVVATPHDLDDTFLSVGEATADLDGDGRPDIVAVGYQDMKPFVRVYDSGKGYSTPAQQPLSNNPGSVTAADLSADHRPDIVVGESHGVDVFLTAPGGGLAPAATYAGGSTIRSPAVGDLDGDGRPDLVVATDTNGTPGLDVYTQVHATSTGPVVSQLTVATATASAVPGIPLAVSAHGLNGDGVAIDATGATTFTIAPDGSCTGAVCTAASLGTHTVTGTSAGLTATTTVPVTVPKVTVATRSAFTVLGRTATFTATVAPALPAGTPVVFTETFTDGKTVPLGQARLTARGTAALTVHPLYNGSVKATVAGGSGSTPSRVIVTFRGRVVATRVADGRLSVHAETRPGFVTSRSRQERAQILLVDSRGKVLKVLAVVDAAQRRSFRGEAQGTNAIDARVRIPAAGTFIAVRVLGTPVNTGAESAPVRF